MIEENNTLKRCVKFLLENGWEKATDNYDKFYSYCRKNSVDVDISEEEIVLIGENGDFLHMNLNYFALVGALIEYRQIGFNYISTL